MTWASGTAVPIFRHGAPSSPNPIATITTPGIARSAGSCSALNTSMDCLVGWGMALSLPCRIAGPGTSKKKTGSREQGKPGSGFHGNVRSPFSGSLRGYLLRAADAARSTNTILRSSGERTGGWRCPLKNRVLRGSRSLLRRRRARWCNGCRPSRRHPGGNWYTYIGHHRSVC